MKNPSTPLEAAAELIRYYVERGDSSASLRRGGMGTFTSSWGAMIGGYPWSGPDAHKKKYGNDKILVHRLKGKDCSYVVPMKEAIKFIKP